MLSSLLLTAVPDKVIKKDKSKMKKVTVGYWQMKQMQMTKFMFKDDMVVRVDSEKNLQYNLTILEQDEDEHEK